MRKMRAATQTAAVLVLMLTASWLVPPMLQRARRLCPVRPNGVSQAQAIPVFARKYKTSCLTCHAPVPIKLNNYGEAFKNSAFRMPSDDEGQVKIEMVPLGAPAWKDLWTTNIYPGELPFNLPISWQLYIDGRYDPNNESAGTHNARSWYWDVPHEFEVMTAGTLGDHISWWANVEFKVKTAQNTGVAGSNAITETPVDFVQAYGQFDHLLNTSLLNLRIGRIEPRVVPFSRVSRRFIAQDMMYAEQALANGFKFADMQGGAELWGAKSIAQTGGGLTYAVGFLNGDKLTNSDNNRTQDLYGRISYKFGGMGVAESLGVDRSSATNNWEDDSVRVGFYGYQGWSGATGKGFRIGGADIDIWFKTLNLYATAWTGMEDISPAAPTVTTYTGPQGQKSTAWTIGADYIYKPWLTGILRYEGADRGTTASQHKRRIIPAIVVGIRPNITWTTEFHIYPNTVTNTAGRHAHSGDEVLRTRLRFIF